MQRLAVLLLGLLSGCASVPTEAMRDLEARLNARLARQEAELSKKIHDTDAKYSTMLAIEQKVVNGGASIERNAELLDLANQRLMEILRAQRNALKEHLASIESQLEVLQECRADRDP